MNFWQQKVVHVQVKKSRNDNALLFYIKNDGKEKVFQVEMTRSTNNPYSYPSNIKEVLDKLYCEHDLYCIRNSSSSYFYKLFTQLFVLAREHKEVKEHLDNLWKTYFDCEILEGLL